MSRRRRPRAQCPVCDETVSFSTVLPAYNIGPIEVIFRRHGPRHSPCPGGGRRWTEAEAFR